MAHEHWGEAERVRRYVRTILERVTARGREQRTADKAAPRPASESIRVEVEREDNRSALVRHGKRPA